MIDKHFCHWVSTELPFNPQLHAFWHIGSSLACYWGTLYVAALRGFVLKQSPSIRYWKHILPYVHILSMENDHNKDTAQVNGIVNGFQTKNKITTKRIRKSHGNGNIKEKNE